MPKSQQIESITHQLREDILGGAFKPYNVLPTRRALADQFETTPDTIAKVLRNLEIEGFVVKSVIPHALREQLPQVIECAVEELAPKPVGVPV